MADFTDRLPLRQETVESISARVLADLNAGIDPTDPTYADAIPGSIWDDLKGTVNLELDRVWDFASTEVPASAMPSLTTGVWLDAWADLFLTDGRGGRGRKDSSYAGGIVRFTGVVGTEIATGTEVTTVAPNPDTDPIAYQTTAPAVIPAAGYIDVEVQAVESGAAGNTAPNTVTVNAAGLAQITGVTNPDVISAGADVETDEQLQQRLERRLQAPGGGANIAFYETEALAEPGVSFATVQANWAGAGTVRVLVTDVDNNPVSPAIKTRLQNRLDPIVGQGEGEAPVGAVVTVDTPATINVDVHGTMAFATGYSLDGAGGTRAMRGAIVDAIKAYVNGLTAGHNVVHNKVLAAIIDVEGVDDVTALTINGAAGDLVVGALQVPTINPEPTLA